MAFPEFFARVPAVTLRDPLAELLGAAEGGLIEYRFADAVKLTVIRVRPSPAPG